MTPLPAIPERQLLLFPDAPALAPEDLRRILERGLGAAVRLSLTRNRTSVLTFKRADDGTYDVRVQRVFLEAPDEVLAAIVQFVRKPAKETRERVVSFFSGRPDADRRSRRAPAPGLEARAAGAVHDLGAILADLNARYFGGRVKSAIAWGDAKRFAGRHGRGEGRSIRFGSYVGEHDLIRIHPTLDADWVPRLFVESVVHHEMLHAVLPIVRDAHGRRIVHPPEFRRRERAFHGFEAAAEWERANLERLIAARAEGLRSGAGMAPLGSS